MGKATSPEWASNSTPQQVRDLIEAKVDLRAAARVVADCPHCAEGWHSVDPSDDSKGVVRCPSCWRQYKNAFEYLRNLDGEFFVEDSMTNFKRSQTADELAQERVRTAASKAEAEQVANARGVSNA